MLAIYYIRSFDGGKSFERPARILTTVVGRDKAARWTE